MCCDPHSCWMIGKKHTQLGTFALLLIRGDGLEPRAMHPTSAACCGWGMLRAVRADRGTSPHRYHAGRAVQKASAVAKAELGDVAAALQERASRLQEVQQSAAADSAELAKRTTALEALVGVVESNRHEAVQAVASVRTAIATVRTPPTPLPCDHVDGLFPAAHVTDLSEAACVTIGVTVGVFGLKPWYGGPSHGAYPEGPGIKIRVTRHTRSAIGTRALLQELNMAQWRL